MVCGPTWLHIWPSSNQHSSGGPGVVLWKGSTLKARRTGSVHWDRWKNVQAPIVHGDTGRTMVSATTSSCRFCEDIGARCHVCFQLRCVVRFSKRHTFFRMIRCPRSLPMYSTPSNMLIGPCGFQMGALYARRTVIPSPFRFKIRRRLAMSR